MYATRVEKAKEFTEEMLIAEAKAERVKNAPLYVRFPDNIKAYVSQQNGREVWSRYGDEWEGLNPPVPSLTSTGLVTSWSGRSGNSWREVRNFKDLISNYNSIIETFLITKEPDGSATYYQVRNNCTITPGNRIVVVIP